MKLRVYTVFDRVAEEAGPLYCAVNDAVAARMYRHLIAETGSADPKDFYLLYVGDYDTKEVQIVGEPEGIQVNVDIGKVVVMTEEKDL